MQLQSFPFSTSTDTSLSQSLLNEEKNFFINFVVYGQGSRQRAEKIRSFILTSIRSPEEFTEIFNSIIESIGVDDEIVAMWFHEDRIVTGVRKGKIWLKRGEKIGTLVQSLGESKIIQGKLQQSDLFVTVNNQAIQYIDEYLEEILSKVSDPELLSSQLMAKIQEFPEVAIAGMCVSTDTLSGESQAEEKNIEVTDESLTSAPVLRKKSISILPSHSFTETKQKITKFFRFVLICGGICVCVGLVILGNRELQLRKTRQFIQPFEVRLQAVQDKARSDKLAARDEALILLKDWEAQIASYSPKGASIALTTSFHKKAQETYGLLSGRTEYSTLPTFYDFRLIRSDFIASHADIDSNLAMFLDPSKSILIQLNLDNKQQLVLPIGDYEVLTDLAFFEERVYLLSKGMYEFQIDSKTSAVKIINEDEANQTAKHLGIFENFLYVLNPEARNIFRYNLEDEENSSTSIGWIQDKKDLDFSQINSLAIDGAVWLGTSQGDILKYERGEKVEFTVKGLEKEFSSPIKVFTKPDFSYLFVLEPAQKRVVILQKDGTYYKEFVHTSLEAGSDLIAREESKSVYVVAGSLLYEMKYE